MNNIWIKSLQESSKKQCFCIPGKLRAKPNGDCTANASAIVLTLEDVTVQLPAQSATLSVSVSPPHTKNENYYTYKWDQQSSPPGVCYNFSSDFIAAHLASFQ